MILIFFLEFESVPKFKFTWASKRTKADSRKIYGNMIDVSLMGEIEMRYVIVYDR